MSFIFNPPVNDSPDTSQRSMPHDGDIGFLSPDLHDGKIGMAEIARKLGEGVCHEDAGQSVLARICSARSRFGDTNLTQSCEYLMSLPPEDRRMVLTRVSQCFASSAAAKETV